jgi:hypothetical protein
MVGSPEHKPNVVRLARTQRTGKLDYAIELWQEDRTGVERLLARAVSAALARAIFKAAQNEHPDRYITLRRGKRLIGESG